MVLAVLAHLGIVDSFSCDMAVREKYCGGGGDNQGSSLIDSCKSCEIGPTCPVQAPCTP
jgi:hypothetical protein